MVETVNNIKKIDIPSLTNEQLNELWESSKKKWSALETLTSRYISVIHDKSPKSAELGKVLCNAIRQVSDQFYPSQRYAIFNSKIKKQLSTYQVFLSHAGEQKGSYVDRVYDLLTEQGVSVFFDIRSLKPGIDPALQMIHAALTCQVGIVILSADFLKKKWTMLELGLFAARQRTQTQLQQLPDSAILKYEENLDYHFAVLPDFYSQNEMSGWVDEVKSIPNFLLDYMPVGVVRFERLDGDHAKVLVSRTLDLLKAGGSIVVPVPIDISLEYSRLYVSFKKARDIAFNLLPEKIEKHLFAEKMLTVALRETAKLNEKELRTVMEDARVAGRHFLTFAFKSRIIMMDEKYFMDQGYCELNNAFLFVAPLDALNFVEMKSLSNVDLTSWGTILCINKRAEDVVHIQFLEEYCRVRNKIRNSDVKRENPFDVTSMATVYSGVTKSQYNLPHFLSPCYNIIQNYLE